MIHILILIALGLATYLFHNYQTFNEASIRPWVLEYVNFNREADPQALCDLLSPDATVTINDTYTRYKYNFSGGKEEACTYFSESASHFFKPQKEKNGYIFDRLSSFKIDHENIFKNYGDVSFTEENKIIQFGLKTVQGKEHLIGKTQVKITIKAEIFKEPKITHYEFWRKLEQPNVEKR